MIKQTGSRIASDRVLRLRLTFRGEIAWDTMLGCLAARAIKGVEHVADGVYRRTIQVEGDLGAIEVALGGRDHLVLTAHLPHRGGLFHVVHQVRRLFNLDADLEAANAGLAGDPWLGGLVAASPGLRAPGAWDPFEVGVRAIVGQQVTVMGASTIAGRLVEQHGSAVPGLAPLGLTHLFPSPAVLANANLNGTGLTKVRIGAIRNFARAVEEGSVRLDTTRSLDEQVASVTQIPGLGPWTAQYLALRMGEADAFPSADLGLRRSLEALTGTAMTPKSVHSLAERWRPWRAHAAIHLWLTAQAPTAKVDVPSRDSVGSPVMSADRQAAAHVLNPSRADARGGPVGPR